MKANHRGVAAFGQSMPDEVNLKMVISNLKWLYDDALKLGALESPLPVKDRTLKVLRDRVCTIQSSEHHYRH